MRAEDGDAGWIKHGMHMQYNDELNWFRFTCTLAGERVGNGSSLEGERREEGGFDLEQPRRSARVGAACERASSAMRAVSAAAVARGKSIKASEGGEQA